ncbi:MAG: hypothetical protein GXP31_17345 [Kiritimatiellaeota bacterium]|nr:hypothetical protein [Kiritimatiellota bacterium]
MVQFISFDLGGTFYGLDVLVVKEISANTDITPVPRAARHVRGLVTIRGEVVLVVDVAVVFGRDPRKVTPDSRIIILRTAAELRRSRFAESGADSNVFGDKPVGFLVDRIGDVITLEDDSVAPPPPHLKREAARFVQGVVHLEGRTLVVLNAAELLTN